MGRVDAWLGMDGKDEPDPEQFSRIVDSDHMAPRRHVWENTVRVSRRVRNQGMECESLLLF